MFGLVERAIVFDRHVAQVSETDPRRKLLGHRDEVVVGARSERAGAKRQAVGGAWNGIEDLPHIGRRRHHAGQAEQAERRVVRMDRELDPHLFGHWHHLAKERDQVVTHHAVVDIRELRQQFGNGMTGVGAEASGQAGNDVALQHGQFVGSHGGDAVLCIGDKGGRIVLFGMRSLQHEGVVAHKVDHVEAHAEAGRGQPVHEVGSRPVNHRHEVVANGRDSRAPQIGERVFPCGDVLRRVGVTELDRRFHRDRLAHCPVESRRPDDIHARLNVLGPPHATVVEMMQSGDDTGGTGLLHVVQGDAVLFAEPAPGFLHFFLLQVIFNGWQSGVASHRSRRVFLFAPPP